MTMTEYRDIVKAMRGYSTDTADLMNKAEFINDNTIWKILHRLYTDNDRDANKTAVLFINYLLH